jgi:hypothetical protein
VLAILGLIFACCLWRKRKVRFDGNFDPHRLLSIEKAGVSGMDLMRDRGVVEPFLVPGGEQGMIGEPEMAYVGAQGGYVCDSPTQSHWFPPAPNLYSNLSPGVAGLGAGAGAVYAAQNQPRSPKEREAFARSNSADSHSVSLHGYSSGNSHGVYVSNAGFSDPRPYPASLSSGYTNSSSWPLP